MLRDVGFNLEAADRDLLMRRLVLRDVGGGDEAVTLEEFVSFFALSEHELDDVAERLKRKLRQEASVDPAELDCKRPAKVARALRRALGELARLGSPNLALSEFAEMVQSAGCSPTPAELARLARRWSGPQLDGEVNVDALVRFVERDSYSHDAVRRRAARVVRACDALRTHVLDSQQHLVLVRRSGAYSTLTTQGSIVRPRDVGEVDSTSAWMSLRARRSRRVRGASAAFAGAAGANARRGAASSSSPSSRASTGAASSYHQTNGEYLDVEDVALALERQLAFGDVPRLSQPEYAQLMALVAPKGAGRCSPEDFHAFAAAPLRPLAELLRIVEHAVLRCTQGLLASYETWFSKAPSDQHARYFTDRLNAALRELRLLDGQGFAKLVSVERLRKEMLRAGGKVADRDDETRQRRSREDLESVSLSEWFALAQHTGADVRTDDDDDTGGGATANAEDANPGKRRSSSSSGSSAHVFLVHSKRLVEGVCRLLVGDVRDAANDEDKDFSDDRFFHHDDRSRAALDERSRYGWAVSAVKDVPAAFDAWLFFELVAA